ncbi:MAG: site-specific DNA-methyltransferase [Candidatus Tectomicrobia bacterium]|nr:site-specific DNA-methyltransferase [Candidatus Tectomicrobia bacterium]
MERNPLPRLDNNPHIRESLLPFCRLRDGEIWEDPEGKHRVGCLDAANPDNVSLLLHNFSAHLAINDPPYNLIAFEERSLIEYIGWCERWVRNTLAHLAQDASCYIWLGADQNNQFQPLPDFMIMMRNFQELKPRSFITLRNQRGYGTQQNWMAIRQELLYYTRGHPPFYVQYTEIPKILRGYYKEVNGALTENLQRSKALTIRPGNVWVDIQQIFYRLGENVSGCYAQKPLRAIGRIISASSDQDNVVLDFFAHAGTTLLACERLRRQCFTMDIDPVYCEITIRRLELFRRHGLLGWQNGDPFAGCIEDIRASSKESDLLTPNRQVSLFE